MDTKTTPLPVFETRRLVLRQLCETDSQAIFELRSSETVNKYIQRKLQTNITEAEAFIAKIKEDANGNPSQYWAICLKNTPNLVGTICLWNFSDDNTMAELGYELNPLHQGKGLMGEAIACITGYAFNQLGLTVIEAYTHKENTRSIKLLTKNGFVLNEGKVDKDVAGNLVFYKRNKVL